MPPEAPKPGYKILLAHMARNDIEDILQWTTRQFGAAGRKRYEKLIQTALLNLARDPNRIGVRQRQDIGNAICSYHLSSSRRQSSTSTQVEKPRHLVLFRIRSDSVEVARVLHDSMDFARHMN